MPGCPNDDLGRAATPLAAGLWVERRAKPAGNGIPALPSNMLRPPTNLARRDVEPHLDRFAAAFGLGSVQTGDFCGERGGAGVEPAFTFGPGGGLRIAHHSRL